MCGIYSNDVSVYWLQVAPFLLFVLFVVRKQYFILFSYSIIYCINQTAIMKLVTLFSTLVASAAAFAPAPKATTTTALNVEIKNQIGAQAPIGFFE